MKLNNKHSGIANSTYVATVEAADDLLNLTPVKEFKKGDVIYHKGFGPVICNQNYSQPSARSYFVDVLWKGHSLMLAADRLSNAPWQNN